MRGSQRAGTRPDPALGSQLQKTRTLPWAHGHPAAKNNNKKIRAFCRRKKKEKEGKNKIKRKNKKEKYSTLFNLAFTAKRALKITLFLNNLNIKC